MRILILTTQIEGRGGIQYVGRLLLTALSDVLGREAEIHVVSVHDRNQVPAENANWTVHGGHGSSWRAARLAARTLRRGPWDLLILGHLHLAPLLLTGRRGRHWKAGLGLVYGLEAWRPLSRLRRLGIERLDRLVFISEHSRDAAYQVNRWMEQMPSEVCYLGLGPESGGRGQGAGGREQEAGGSRGEPGEDFALSIGRMASGEAYKGFEEMIRVWLEVERRRPGFPLVIIGDGDDHPRLQQLAIQLGANVRFLGAVDDSTRDAHLRACRCFCLPSRGEGFGLVYLEAMREGKPVLAGSQDAGREVVVDGVTGRMVDARDPEQLVAGILDVSGEHSAEMGQAGKRRLNEQFSYSAFRDRLRRLLDQSRTAKKQ
jgi:glycosyltransferase involved in cell wall biosynthesis